MELDRAALDRTQTTSLDWPWTITRRGREKLVEHLEAFHTPRPEECRSELARSNSPGPAESETESSGGRPVPLSGVKRNESSQSYVIIR